MTKLENPPFQGSISHRNMGGFSSQSKNGTGGSSGLLQWSPTGGSKATSNFLWGEQNSRLCCFCWWLNQPPLTNGFIFPKVRAEIKNDWNHHLEIIEMLAKNNPLFFFSFLKKKQHFSSTLKKSLDQRNLLVGNGMFPSLTFSSRLPPDKNRSTTTFSILIVGHPQLARRHCTQAKVCQALSPSWPPVLDVYKTP